MIGGHVLMFFRISVYVQGVPHRLPVQQLIHYRISSIVWHCVIGNAPVKDPDPFILTLACFVCWSLRSASSGDFVARHATKQNRAFSIVSSSVRNGFLINLRSLLRTSPTLSIDYLRLSSSAGLEHL